jgi:large repetitive protein
MIRLATITLLLLLTHTNLTAQIVGNIIYQLDGGAIEDYFGHAVSGLGDVDGDGVPDLIVGAPDTDPGGRSHAGSAYVYSGATGALIYRIDGAVASDNMGMAVSNAGDINGDGVEDFIVGAQRVDNGLINEAGAAFVYSGATGQLLHSFYGDSNDGDRFGASVSGGGDVDGDGVPDLIVGAYKADYVKRNTGSVYVYSGLSGTLIYRFDGTLDNEYGRSVADAGDVNGDGYADIIVGARLEDSGSMYSNGAAIVYSGSTGAVLYRFNGEATNDLFGTAVAGAGDVDGDGYADLVVGATDTDFNGWDSGSAYVYSGYSGLLIYRLRGVDPYGELGAAVAGIGDVNNDGMDDFVATADWADANGNLVAGSAFVYSGATGSILHKIDGDQADYLGTSISGAGDINGDGFIDVIIGCEKMNPSNLLRAGAAITFSLAPPPPILTLSGTCPGIIYIDILGASNNGNIAIVYGSAGSFTVPNGPCAGVILDISSPTLAGYFHADANGELNISTPSLPSTFCGLTVQVVDTGTCFVSNWAIIQ